MSIIDIGYKNDYDIIEKTKVNGKKIYQIIIGACRTYFYEKHPRGDYKYILLHRIMDSYQYYRLIGIYYDANESDPAYVELKETINGPQRDLKKYQQRDFRQIIKKYDIKEIDLDSLFRNKPGCGIRFDLKRAHNILRELNYIIEEECNDIQLHLDYVHNMKDKVFSFSNAAPNDLVLCLYYKDECISSIELIPKEDKKKIDINSFTETAYEGKKYNKLLRIAAFLIVSILIPVFPIMSSVAINPISAWLTIHTLNGRVVTKDDENRSWVRFIKSKYGDSPYRITNELIREYFDESEEALVVNVEVNDENVMNAMEQFRQIVQTIGCERKPKKRFTMPSSNTQKTRKSRSKSKSKSRSKSRSNSPK